MIFKLDLVSCDEVSFFHQFVHDFGTNFDRKSMVSGTGQPAENIVNNGSNSRSALFLQNGFADIC